MACIGLALGDPQDPYAAVRIRTPFPTKAPAWPPTEISAGIQDAMYLCAAANRGGLWQPTPSTNPIPTPREARDIRMNTYGQFHIGDGPIEWRPLQHHRRPALTSVRVAKARCDDSPARGRAATRSIRARSISRDTS